MEKEPKITTEKKPSSAEATEGKKEKPQHEIELEERPNPQEGEPLDIWLKRIGGPHAEVIGNLKIDPIFKLSEKEKEYVPFIISRNGDFILNDKNLGKHFNVESINKLLEEKNLNIRKKETEKRGIEYRLKKDLFETPTDYFNVIVKGLEKKQCVVADKAFAKNVEKWAEEFEEEKAPPIFEEEFSEEDFSDSEAPTPAKGEVGKEPEKKPLTLDEKIEQKEKELEEVEQNYNIYYSPVVQDLLGLYYKSEFKSLKKEVKKLKKARKKVGGEVAAIEETPKEFPEKKPIAKEYLKHIKYTNKLFIKMVKVRGAVKREEADPSEYEEIKSEWRTAYNKTGEMYDGLSEEDQEKTIKKREKEMKKPAQGWSALGRKKIEKAWKDFWELFTKKFGKETIEEVTKDAIGEQLKVIRKEFKKVSEEIKEGGVLGRADKEKKQARLEKEQKRLQGRLKKFE